LIPNLVEVVKQYASHETAVFQNVSEMRAKLMQGQTSTEERFANENTLFTGMKSLFAIAENYPELKASTNFLDLQNQWGEMEDRLQ
jgi:LemA protein